MARARSGDDRDRGRLVAGLDRWRTAYKALCGREATRHGVGGFYCVLALMVAGLMVREADGAGMQMSVRELLSTLAGIEDRAALPR